MTRLETIRFISATAVAIAGADAASAQAAPSPLAPPVAETLRLSPQEKADIAAHQTEALVDAARAGLAGGGGREVHGEIGTAIGTHGLRDIYGTAAIPLGDHADAIVSFEDGRYGPRHR